MSRKMMEIVDDPLPVGSKIKDEIDLYILCEGFKYTLREWRRWTRGDVEMIDGCIYTRGEYSMLFVKEIIGFLHNNGYILKYSVDSIARRFMHYWLKLYNSKGYSSRLPIQQHNGTNEELEEWNELFTYDFWEEITEDFIVHNGFDDTNVGKELLYGIGTFFWIYIDVNNSPKIVGKREEDKLIQEEMMRWANDGDYNGKSTLSSIDKTNEDKNKHNNEHNNRNENNS
jgi:hypothetical protein